MKNYIGTKIIKAAFMTRGEYHELRSWPLPADKKGDDYGYLVEDTDAGNPNLEGYVGYVSWSPAAQFENTYRQTSGLTGMTFGLAIEALKKGCKVARAGWNGKDMWLSLSGDLRGTKIRHEKFWSQHNRQFAFDQPLSEARVLPCITMKTSTGEILMGWLASQTDMLAEDWSIVY